MRLLKLAAAAFCFVLFAKASAQKLPTATAQGGYIAAGATYGAFEAQYPQQLLGGPAVFVDLTLRQHFGLEGEVRFLRQNQIAGSHQTSYLVGPRFEMHRGRYSPYVKGLIGGAKLVFPYGDGYGTYTAFAFGGGLDIRLTREIRLRAIDFEYQNWPSFNLGPGTPQAAITPYGVSAGLSYQIYQTGGWRKHRYK